ncbi:MAG: hypothetical protein ACI89E_001107 [Planctomycetota bacterium]|jgi:hypothetical protein
MIFNFLPLVLLAIAASPDKLIVTKGPLPDGGSYEIQVRNEKDGSQRKHGYAKYFDAAGKLELSGRHAKGLRTGKWEAWHPGGIQSWKGSYKKGIRCKEWRCYNAKGTQIDHLTGTWALSDERGFGDAIRLAGYTVDGIPQGYWRLDWWNGQLFTSGVRNNGLREGPWAMQHPDGSPASGLATGVFIAGRWIRPVGDAPATDLHIVSLDLPDPKPYKRKDPANTRNAQALLETLKVTEQRLKDVAALDSDQRDQMLGELAGFFGGHGLGWSWGTEPADEETRAEAIKSAHTLITLLGNDTYFWALPGDGSAPPEDATTQSPFFQKLSPFKENWGFPQQLARTVYRERTVRSMQTGKSRKAENGAIDASLAWLASIQKPNGRWPRMDTHTSKGAEHEVGLTSLALLAFLANDSQPLNGPHSGTIVRGLNALIDAQGRNGIIKAKDTGLHVIYGHCLATIALAEAFGTSGHPALLEPTQRAVAFLLKAKNPHGGWRYSTTSPGDTDTSVTAWAYQALYSAHLVGIPIEDQVTANVLDWVDSVTDTSTGRVGYIGPVPGGRSSRVIEINDQFPPEHGEPMTAAGLVIRSLAFRAEGLEINSAPNICEIHEDLMARSPLSWEEDRQDSYNAYFSSLACSIAPPRLKGKSPLPKWRKTAVNLILKGQVKKGTTAGSWDPIDAWGSYGGRVFTTAMYTLSIDNQWRFAR